MNAFIKKLSKWIAVLRNVVEDNYKCKVFEAMDEMTIT
jgi:hypothetical protein